MSQNKPTTEQIQISDTQTLNAAIDTSGVWVGNSDIPQNLQGVPYTLALSDRGKHICTSQPVTIPANSSVSFPIGSAVTVFNQSGANITISITTDTLILAGSYYTGTKNLTSNGIVTLLKVANTRWVGSGQGFG